MTIDQIAAAESVLRDADGRPSPRYAAYLKYQSAYQAAKDAYDSAFAAAQLKPAQLQNWPIIGTKYRRALDDAFDRWTALGNKAVIENALAIVGAPFEPTPSFPTEPPGCD